MDSTELYLSPTSQLDSQSGFFGNISQLDWLALITRIKNEVLGQNYQLSVNIVDADTIKNLNKTWRQKDHSTDVLSFPYGDDEGELFLCPEIIAQRFEDYGRSIDNFVMFLVVHSLHHLKGLDHGPAMEEAEKTTRTKFKI